MRTKSGNVGEMVTNMNRTKTEFDTQQDAVKAYMEYRHVDPKLRNRILRWFRYIW